MSKVDWSLAPDDATHWDCRQFVSPSFMRKPEGSMHWMFYGGGEWHLYGGLVDTEEAKLIERPKPKQWSGPEDGLPPIGLEVEATYDDGSYSWGYWLNTKVLCYGEERTFVNQLSRGTENTWLEGAITSAGLKYRPIKTAEQLAAESRESAIRELMDIAQVDCRVTAARLVDAGFKREVV